MYVQEFFALVDFFPHGLKKVEYVLTQASSELYRSICLCVSLSLNAYVFLSV